MSILEESHQSRDLSSYTKGGLRAALLEDVSAFLLQRQPDDVRKVIRQPEAFSDGETHYVTITLPAWKHITGHLQVCVYAEDDVELDSFVTALTPLEAADHALAMLRTDSRGYEYWAKEYLLRIGRFLEKRFGFRTTAIVSPYIFQKTRKYETEVAEVLGRVWLHTGESILVGVERWREIPR